MSCPMNEVLGTNACECNDSNDCVSGAAPADAMACVPYDNYY